MELPRRAAQVHLPRMANAWLTLVHPRCPSACNAMPTTLGACNPIVELRLNGHIIGRRGTGPRSLPYPIPGRLRARVLEAIGIPMGSDLEIASDPQPSSQRVQRRRCCCTAHDALVCPWCMRACSGAIYRPSTADATLGKCRPTSRQTASAGTNLSWGAEAACRERSLPRPPSMSLRMVGDQTDDRK